MRRPGREPPQERLTIVTNDINSFKDALSTGSSNIGALVYWRRLEGVKIERSRFRQGFEDIGLGKAVGKDPKPEACMNQAAGIASRKQGKDGRAVRIELKSKDALATYAVLVRRDTPDGRRRYIEEAHCSVVRGVRQPPPMMDKVVDLHAAPDEIRDQVIREFDARYQELLQYAMTLELSEALISALALLKAIPLRTGVYFIPEANVAQARALKAFIEGETDVQLSIWGIARNDENAAEAGRDARNTLTDRFRTILDEVQGYIDGLEGATPSTKSVNARAKHFLELEAQVELYSEILGDYQQDLSANIAQAKKALLGAYLGDDESDAEVAA